MSYMLGLCDPVKTALGEKMGGEKWGGGGGRVEEEKVEDKQHKLATVKPASGDQGLL